MIIYCKGCLETMTEKQINYDTLMTTYHCKTCKHTTITNVPQTKQYLRQKALGNPQLEKKLIKIFEKQEREQKQWEKRMTKVKKKSLKNQNLEQ